MSDKLITDTADKQATKLTWSELADIYARFIVDCLVDKDSPEEYSKRIEEAKQEFLKGGSDAKKK